MLFVKKIRTSYKQIFFKLQYAQKFIKIIIFSWFITIYCNKVSLISFEDAKHFLSLYSVEKSSTDFPPGRKVHLSTHISYRMARNPLISLNTSSISGQ